MDIEKIAAQKGAPNFHRAVNSTRAITDAPNLRDQNARSCWSCAFFQRIEGDWESRRGVCSKFEFDTNEDWICDAWAEKPPEPLQVEVIDVVTSDANASDGANDDDMMKGMEFIQTLVAFGSPIKSLGENKIGGYLVRFGSPQQTDLEGEYFDAQTDFGFAKGTTIKTPLWFNHRFPLDTKSGKQIWIKQKIGEGELSIDDEGVFIEAVTYNRALYDQVLDQLGWSSGTAQHLVETEQVGKAVHIKAWPLGLDASLTPIPAEPRNRAVPLKALQTKHVPKADAQDAGNASSNATNDDGIANSNPKNSIQVLGANNAPTEGNQMPENQTTPADSLEAKFAAFSAKVETFMQQMQDSPALKNAGYFTQDGGAADKNVKSFGDFLMAVKRNDAKRLKEIYGSVKTLNEGQGESGGYIVPTAYSTELLQVANTASPLLGLVRSIPVETDAGEWPVLDQYAAPTAGVGNTAMAAAVTAAPRAEAGTYTETEPDFEMLKWRVHSISGITPVSKELNADSPQAIEALLTTLFGIAIGAKKEYYILRGNGAGQPLGILNAAAAIGVTPATNNAFAFVDAMTMISRFKKITNNVRWVYHPSIIPDFAGASWVQGDLPIKLTDVGYGEGVTSEHLPQADNSGAVLLADFGAYLLFERGGIEIAFSEHAYFTSGRVAWRFDQRLDGQPWMKNAITLADPQGSFTISPFVYHND